MPVGTAGRGAALPPPPPRSRPAPGTRRSGARLAMVRPPHCRRPESSRRDDRRGRPGAAQRIRAASTLAPEPRGRFDTRGAERPSGLTLSGRTRSAVGLSAAPHTHAEVAAKSSPPRSPTCRSCRPSRRGVPDPG
jgi:hypothetical protein